MKPFLFLSFTFAVCIANAQQVYFIPKQFIEPLEILQEAGNPYRDSNQPCRLEVDSFEVSRQITLGEFKEYIIAIQKDSSAAFCKSQMPDSTITSIEKYKAYLNNPYYNAYPAAGITWESAMNFCKWKTFKENNKDPIRFIYRLPKHSEWLAAYTYLTNHHIKNDFNQHFSDWTMQLYFEGGYSSDSCFVYRDMSYYPIKTDHPSYHRMVALGNSFYFQSKLAFRKGYYTFKGYRHIAFRIVKVYLKEKPKYNFFLNEIFKSWGITKP